MSPEQENMEPKEQFSELIETEDVLRVREFLNNTNISEVAELIYEFPDYESQIMGHLSLHRASSTFKILDVPTQKRIMQELPPMKTAELLNDLSADDRTSFLEELPSEVVKELIKTLDPEERKITLSLLGYPEGSVGRLMTPDYIAVEKDWTVREVLDHIREVGKDSETIDVIYVVDDKGDVALKPVTVKSYESNDVVISGGVAEGAKVVVLGVQKLDPSQKVRVVSALSF